MLEQATRMELARDATLTSLTEKLAQLDDFVSGTVQSVSDSVQSARDSVDLKLQVRRRPWTLVAGQWHSDFWVATAHAQEKAETSCEME